MWTIKNYGHIWLIPLRAGSPLSIFSQGHERTDPPLLTCLCFLAN